eukprot:gene57595-biopygen96863
MPAMATVDIDCGGQIARYVNVRIPGSGKTLTLCEVQVLACAPPAAAPYNPGSPSWAPATISPTDALSAATVAPYDLGTPSRAPSQPDCNLYSAAACERQIRLSGQCQPAPPNLAAGKTTAQSSTWGSAISYWAVDGYANPLWDHGSCTHTANGTTDPWWRVDLAAMHHICTVRITNRADCCGEWLTGFEVRAGVIEGDGTANHNCGIVDGNATTATVDIDCGGQAARYVNVRIPGSRDTSSEPCARMCTAGSCSLQSRKSLVGTGNDFTD